MTLCYENTLVHGITDVGLNEDVSSWPANYSIKEDSCDVDAQVGSMRLLPLN